MGRHRASHVDRGNGARPQASPLGWLCASFGVLGMLAFPFTGWSESLSAGIVLTSLSVMAAVMSRVTACGEMSVDVSATRLAVGDRLDVTVNVRNPGASAMPAGQALLVMGTGTLRIRVPGLGAGRTATVRLQADTSTRCVMDVGPVVVRTGDPFGLMHGERRLGGTRRVSVHPRTVRCPLPDTGVRHDLDGRPNGRTVDDDLDFQGLREYRPGDDLRAVHWLSTSRMGTLMVRQYEASCRVDTDLMLDAGEEGYADDAEFELAVGVFASIGVQCLLSRRPLTAEAGGASIRPGSVEEFLDFCSAITTMPAGDHAGPHAVTGRHVLSRQEPRAFRPASPVLQCTVIGSAHDPAVCAERSARLLGPAGLVLQTLRRSDPTGQDLPVGSGSGPGSGSVFGSDVRFRPLPMYGTMVACIGTLDELPMILEALP
ncbi:DUF58 domain-containing protein [Bifidobacterium amazonense]|uniref:DUF58 domain-containing protein n=1 Tax=Bifidobacterium amazonense TaxID=2809027 RepID=A0ABS9VTI9_9BIFI|nr:DUF58 domain-containing protein [Bifidobacterium amazonense]MCH9275286.1 DUF58 domain-containing protein [Bifidobacterium amazonense]